MLPTVMIPLHRGVTTLTVWALVALPVHIEASRRGTPAETTSATRTAASPEPLILLERARVAAASGLYRPQNTARVTTGTIREDNRRRSAIAFAISGALAFTGAGLWRWIPCRNATAADPSEVGGVAISGYNKCYTSDGERRPWDTPTKAMFAAGIGLEVVSLLYLIAHLREDDSGARSSP